jgi:hypothetical protein
VIAVVGITDEVDRAAGLAEEGQPNNSLSGPLFRWVSAEIGARLPAHAHRTRIHSHFHRYVTPLCLADPVLATDNSKKAID